MAALLRSGWQPSHGTGGNLQRFTHTATYIVLHLIRSNTGAFLPRYIYLISFEVLLSYILAPAAYASMFLVTDIQSLELGVLQTRNIEAAIATAITVLGTWPTSVIRVGYRYVYDFQSLVNVVLLYLAIALCLLPTLFHIMLLLIDFVRLVFRSTCEWLMEIFDKLASQPTYRRRLLLTAVSIASGLGFLLE